MKNCVGAEGCLRPIHNHTRQLCKIHYNREWKAGRVVRAPLKPHCEKREIKAAWRRRNAEKSREWCRIANRKAKTGFTRALFEASLAYQRNACAVCQIPLSSKGLSRLHCDHAHGPTPIPRGLLCCACNIALGYYERSQRPAGLRIAQYETYLGAPPAQYILQMARALCKGEK